VKVLFLDMPPFLVVYFNQTWGYSIGRGKNYLLWGIIYPILLGEWQPLDRLPFGRIWLEMFGFRLGEREDRIV
jgi:hypothetical protein